MSRPVRRQATLGEHFFWFVVGGVALCTALAVLLFVAA